VGEDGVLTCKPKGLVVEVRDTAAARFHFGPDWLFELKYDGFRALAVIEHGRVKLLSRNGHPFASFPAAESISDFHAERTGGH
jgi:ATP-dependent DNA ligase